MTLSFMKLLLAKNYGLTGFVNYIKSILRTYMLKKVRKRPRKIKLDAIIDAQIFRKINKVVCRTVNCRVQTGCITAWQTFLYCVGGPDVVVKINALRPLSALHSIN